ncbi:MAG: MlaD family protein [Solirubrobacteraceae bacterium]|nr:MlaD family protein [Solirubrobacteraceae bacterium]
MSVRRVWPWAVVALLVGAVVLLVRGGGTPTTTVGVELAGSGGLRVDSAVQIGGVAVGRVAELRVTPQDRVRATLEIRRDAGPVNADASILVRPANLLGEKLVDLHVGEARRPLGDRRIPVGRTKVTVELDQVLDVLDGPVRDRLAILVDETAVALSGRGRDLRRTLTGLAPSVEDTTRLVREVADQDAALRRLLERSGRTLATLAPHGDRIGELVATTAAALQATADGREELRATLARAPGTLRRLDTTLQRLDAAGTALRPASDGLRAVAPALTATLHDLPGFQRAARPALRSVRRASPDLTRLGREVTPVVARALPTLRALEALARDGDALLRSLDLGAPHLLGLLENWARAIQPRDGLGHVFRVSLVLGPDTLRALMPALADEPEATATTRRGGAVAAASRTEASRRAARGLRRAIDRAVGR